MPQYGHARPKTHEANLCTMENNETKNVPSSKAQEDPDSEAKSLATDVLHSNNGTSKWGEITSRRRFERRGGHKACQIASRLANYFTTSLSLLTRLWLGKMRSQETTHSIPLLSIAPNSIRRSLFRALRHSKTSSLGQILLMILFGRPKGSGRFEFTGQGS